ncbi:hypothetical protein C5167_005452 [Papaver somniferum]|uniref:Uncharacterized protein n=1 Tax=Papaver somniferum TaxID=3469 RepID=A0A4Y7JDL8_PAPSO|nr:hypothetical protein C5167_005452 [Papaver somniferum]
MGLTILPTSVSRACYGILRFDMKTGTKGSEISILVLVSACSVSAGQKTAFYGVLRFVMKTGTKGCEAIGIFHMAYVLVKDPKEEEPCDDEAPEVIDGSTGSAATSTTTPKHVPTAKGQALADECGIKFFETVSKNLPGVYESKCGASLFL